MLGTNAAEHTRFETQHLMVCLCPETEVEVEKTKEDDEGKENEEQRGG